MVDAKFEGESIANCIANIMARLGEQLYELPFIVFGIQFYEKGILKSERDFNNKIKGFRQWVLDLINDQRAVFNEEYKSGVF